VAAARDDAPSLGAHWRGAEVEFRVFSAAADAVELCLFDPAQPDRGRCMAMQPLGAGFWSIAVPDAGPGTQYGYRAHGPESGDGRHRCNPAKLLVDPYAMQVQGEALWHASLEQRDGRGRPSTVDSAPFAPRSVVVDRSFDWRGVPRPRIAWNDTFIYECHVKGLTMLHPDVPPALRGTYLGLASDAVLAHLRALGVTSVELLPVQQVFHERHLVEGGRVNYWGYAPLAYFAPDNRYATRGGPGPVVEFKEMVRRLHEAGIEVLLDVVYNHTCEGTESGPLLSLRGLDDATYYRLEPDGSGRYLDFSGCGNTLASHRAVVSKLIVESLRYWVTDMHVDGFRFDLAATLARDDVGAFSADSLVEALADDPVLRGVKLIAEPWDLGPGGYRLGRFPGRWREWNPEYRDSVRRFWRGDAGEAGTFATRVAGSSDVFDGRSATAGINFVACHDGFTLLDSVRYERKHNLANGEEGRDGHEHNFSCNWGHEGPSSDPQVERVRGRVARALLATLALSRGVPMLQQGDDLCRTQDGNNNAYCQDNPTSWVHWRRSGQDALMLELARRAFALRRERPQLRVDSFYSEDDVTWRRADGEAMEEQDWHSSARRGIVMQIHDEADDGDLLLVFNAGARAHRYRLPTLATTAAWKVVLDSSLEPGLVETVLRDELLAPAHTVVVLVQTEPAA
jgi:glycogen operon protein